MEQCPSCKRYTVAYDGYKQVNRCMVDGCGCEIVDKDHYSILRLNTGNDLVERVKVKREEGISMNPEVIKSYPIH